MNIHLTQLGCRLNFSENHQLARALQGAGHVVVNRPEQAHVAVVNTCAVTVAASGKSRRLLRHLHRSHPDLRIVATGCHATLEPAATGQLPGVWRVVPNQDKDLLPNLLQAWSAELPDLDTLLRLEPDASPLPQDAGGRSRAFVKAQDGCENRCTFCVVTLARGAGRSRPAKDVVLEMQSLADEGFREAVLTGVHLGSWGRDLEPEGLHLAELVHRVLSETDMPRLRLSSLEPWDVPESFFDLWQAWPERLCPHLHLPLQSGSDRTLRRMARRCTQAGFRELTTAARAVVPDLVLTTDVIAGFPGETEQDFADSLEFIEEMAFADAHVFPFSARPGTAAAAFGDQLPNTEKSRRVREVQSVVAVTGDRERRRFLNTRRKVLWEGDGTALDDGVGTLWQGYTDNYLRVETVVPVGQSLSNQIMDTHLAALDGIVFQGRIAADPASSGKGISRMPQVQVMGPHGQ
ncbi:MAG: tRNA (N(6)-L-threonylcarbamoyladenosine(37)-C(2))-methylthiotransferase MtaB [Caldilineaceae bacterium]|nr:tRNA (N(6)-L-threonylcarbamoyladenosine(37)-C(2))-methylthiotransferase MtaB [Caldilineaceae bacterium]